VEGLKGREWVEVSDIVPLGHPEPGRGGGKSGERKWARSIAIRREGPMQARHGSAIQYQFRRSLQSSDLQTKQDRASRLPEEDFRRDAKGIIEPPYDLEYLGNLLYDSPDFYRTVDQLATDVAGMGWDLIDAENPEREMALVPEYGDVERTASGDAESIRQRTEAKKRLEGFGRDFQGTPMPLASFCKVVMMDRESTGEGWIEIVPDAQTGAPVAGFHIPSRLVRKRWDGTFVQIDEIGREVAFFRRFGSNSQDQTSVYSGGEARVAGVEPGSVKHELYEFRHYHTAELWYGVPPIIAALASVLGNIFSDTRNVRYFFNRGMPDWLVEIRADRSTFDEDGSNTIIDEYEQAIVEHMHYIIQGDDHRTLILRLPTGEIETKWEKLDTGIEDKDFLLGFRTSNRDIVVGVYRVLPRRLGIVETANLGGGSGESEEETYKRAQIDPRQELVEAFYNAILDRWQMTLVRHKFREIDVMDEQREMSLFAAASASGSLSENEERAWLSTIRKDQDFPERETDLADIPKWEVEMQIAGVLGGTLGQGEEESEETVVMEEAGAQDGVALTQGNGTRTGVPNEGQTRVPRLPPSMQLAVDPRYASIRRELTRRFRDRMAARRQVLLETAGRLSTVGANAGKHPETVLKGKV
jgi:capsid portal protein